MSIAVSNRVRASSRQRRTPRLLLLEIADYADDRGVAWPSVATLAGRIGETERNTYRVLRLLAESGELLTLPGGGRKRTTIYGVASGLSTLEVERLRAAMNAVADVRVTEKNPDILDTVSERNPDIPGQETLTFPSRPEAPNLAPEWDEPPHPAGGIHHVDPDHGSLPTGEGARSAPPPPPPAPRSLSPSRNRAPRAPARDPNQDHPAAQLYHQETGYRPSRDQARDMAEGYTRGGMPYPPVTDMDLWRDAIREVRRQRASSQNVGWMLDLYHAPERLRPREDRHAQDQRGGYRRGGGRPTPGASGGDATLEQLLSYLEDAPELRLEDLSPATARAAA